jgi:hypothetical protein
LTFLLAAHRVASTHDYFPWRHVGRLLKWEEKRAKAALWSLEADLLVSGSLEDETRLLPAGRRVAERLQRTHARQVRAASLVGTWGRMRKR